MLELLLTPEIFKAFVTLVSVLIVAFLALRGKHLVSYFRVVFQVYTLLERLSVLTKWEGYEKLAIAMEELQGRFFEEFGREPSPKEEGWAVRIFNLLAKLEDKTDTEDFFEGLPED